MVSTANWAPPNRGEPFAKISSWWSSRALGTFRSMSRTMTFTATRWPLGTHGLRHSTGTPSNLALEHVARWWPKMDGHTGTNARREGEATAKERTKQGGINPR